MADDAIPAEVRELVNRHLPTMDHVQVLLRLQHAPGGAYLRDIAAPLSLDEQTVAGALEDLVAAGIAERDPATGRYRCVPGTDATRGAVEALEVLYNTRPVTLVRLIYDRPSSALRSFSNAFRLRRPGE